MPSAASCGFLKEMLCIPVLIRFRLEVFVGSYRPSYNMSQKHLVISSAVHVAIDNTNGAMHQSERTIWGSWGSLVEGSATGAGMDRGSFALASGLIMVTVNIASDYPFHCLSHCRFRTIVEESFGPNRTQILLAQCPSVSSAVTSHEFFFCTLIMIPSSPHPRCSLGGGHWGAVLGVSPL
ncbi:hypothetical protein BS47DRAFT_1389565 [Hydnum rufescens UP504]|uniref:Uncharacterized protein n=1 Tax=Hydnum rufescens UP504 TaxID=1448309 RepID=A0A9P6E0I1_9AGAM|nr:hypothetical protein BS47DRAFT_1389565 [Hydnum rufescens UP504]